jgi:histidine triad (HIT) family protein
VEEEKVIYRGDDIAVFPPLKSGALKEGHLLAVPVDHTEDFLDLDQNSSFFQELQDFLRKLEEKSDYEGFNLISANGESAQQSVKHFHFHIVPRKEGDGYDLWPDTEYSGGDFEEANNRLREILD